MKPSILLAVVPVLLVLVACGEDELSGPRCADGTVASGSQCVPRVSCGEGTEQIGQLCVNPENATCGDNTVEIDGECRAVADMTCDSGTVLVDSACVGDPGPSCGSGTALDSSECVVADELSCGSGTERVGDECLPSVTCGPGTTLVEADCISDRVLGNSLNTVCDAIAGEFCEEMQTCCGAQPTELSLTFRDVFGSEASCDVYMTANCFQNVTNDQAAAVALGQAELSVDPLATLSPYFSIDTCALTLPIYDAVQGQATEVVMVTPLQGAGDDCTGNFACTGGLTCVEDTEDEPACRTRGSAGIACDFGDDDDCQDGFYCGRHDNVSMCIPYGTLHVGVNDDCSDRLCDPDIAWCDAGTCKAYVAAAGTCSVDAACGPDAYCREGACTASRQVTESCDETLDLCGTDLVCTEAVCADTVSTCVFFDEEEL